MSSRLFPPDHPQRIELADEVHARPPEPLATPARASYVAVLVEHEMRDAELRHLQVLCKRHDVAPPPLEVRRTFASRSARCA